MTVSSLGDRGVRPSFAGGDRWRVTIWALPVAAAWALARALESPPLGAALVAILAASGIAWVAVRRLGITGAWLVALPMSILLGEMAAVGAGGQSGRLLWVDALLALGALAAIARGRPLRIPRASFLVALVPLVAWCGLGLLWSPDPLTAVAELKEWMVAGIAGVAAVMWIRDPARARRVLGAVALAGTLVAAAMVWTAVRHPAGLVVAVMLKLVDLPWGRSNYLAGILILAFPLALGLLGHARSAWGRVGWAACLATLALGLVVSASKGAIGSLLAALLTAHLLVRGVPRVIRLTLVAAVGAGVALYLATPLHQVLSYRLATGALDYSSGERFALYRLAWDCFLRHPWTGIGLNNFSVAANALHGIDTVPHNLELGFLAELGPLGLALAMGFVLAIGRSCWRCRSFAVGVGERSLALGLWGGWLAFFLHNQIESTLYGEQMKLLLFLSAAAAWRLSQPNPLPEGTTSE